MFFGKPYKKIIIIEEAVAVLSWSNLYDILFKLVYSEMLALCLNNVIILYNSYHFNY